MKPETVVDLIHQALRKFDDPQINDVSLDGDNKDCELILTTDDGTEKQDWIIRSNELEEVARDYDNECSHEAAVMNPEGGAYCPGCESHLEEGEFSEWTRDEILEMSRDDLICTGAAGIGIDTKHEYDFVTTKEAMNSVLRHYGYEEE